MKEFVKRGKENLVRFYRSQTSERLALVGFGCSVAGCEWTVKKNRIQDYSKALREHGQHNTLTHPVDLNATITWLYKQT